MKTTNNKFKECVFLLIFSSIFYPSPAKISPPISESIIPPQNLTATHQWWTPAPSPHRRSLNQGIRSLLAGSLSFIAAAISSAGGLGGGGLFVPILTTVARLDVKTASCYSAFMVTGGAIANVGNQLLSESGGRGLIDYDMVLLCEPGMLLGVSCGVVLNLVFPEWLITLLFVVFVAFCTFKTCRSGVLYWNLESRGMSLRGGNEGMGDEDGGGSTKVPLLRDDCDEAEGGKLGTPLMKIGMLLVIWICFLALYLLRGNRNGQVEACGRRYWIISSLQIPLAILFTSWILFRGKGANKNALSHQESGSETRSDSSDKTIFPIMAVLAGLLGGVFGIGGAMLISPILLQMGIHPEVTAATCSLMVLFSSTMSATQYLLLGMEHIDGALTYAAICFLASLLGLTIIQQAVLKHGRPSLIVFSVGTVMALSILLMASFGAMDVWKNYESGQSMGFQKPC